MQDLISRQALSRQKKEAKLKFTLNRRSSVKKDKKQFFVQEIVFLIREIKRFL